MENFIYVVLGLVLLLAIYIGVSYHLFKRVFYYYNDKDMQLVDPTSEFYQESYAWYEDVPKEDVHINTYDGLKLHGVYIPSINKNSSHLAIVLHGYQSKGYDMVIIAKMYSDLGFKVLLVDQRGHGESEGKFTSMGYYEAMDLKKWLHFASRTYGSKTEVLLHGVSMGAATAAMLLKYPESHYVKMMVLDSMFTNFSDSIKLQLKNSWIRFFIPGVSFVSFLRLKFFLKQVNPLKYIKHSHTPTLFIHSEKDGVVSKEMTDMLYQHLHVEQKDILTVEDARHAKAFEIDKDGYISAVIDLTSQVFRLKKSDINYTK